MIYFCSALPSSGGELEQIQFLPEHVSVQTTERYAASGGSISGQ